MCEIDYGDLEGWRVSSEKIRRARKHYQCDTCGGSIPVGAHYLAHFSVSSDGDPCSEKACLFCEAAHAEFADEHDVSTTPNYFPVLLRECFEGEESPRWGVMLEAMRQRQVAYEDLYGGAR